MEEFGTRKYFRIPSQDSAFQLELAPYMIRGDLLLFLYFCMLLKSIRSSGVCSNKIRNRRELSPLLTDATRSSGKLKNTTS